MIKFKELLVNEQIQWVKLKDVCEMKRGRTISKKYIADNVAQYPVYCLQALNDPILVKMSTYGFNEEYVKLHQLGDYDEHNWSH
ncbi:restriction endonuclease subunit S [Ureaplasma sp. ES3154-GEN]|uniref:restriction endonuclease subunit S n=1 Tax=Ureaplasma sp. ES3154-GEN TaxID=2984844 RepID=UPI0021E8D251|nr:restriction endonuclease subunit S [Ureaplasma sp. ES3154-GEN]MCV3743553.1 restriction endonuclease subunit S [Ureaplasma sp. ES3154-GEN]